MGNDPNPHLANKNKHFHVGRANETCGKTVRPRGVVSNMMCGKKRDDPVHLYYTCPVDWCDKPFYSIESRIQHMEMDHGLRS